MSSGTDAELAILMALGLGPGDAVITTPYIALATAGCIHRVGAETVCRRAAGLAASRSRETARAPGRRLPQTAKGNRIKAIMPVHLFGTCYDVDAINQIAAEPGLIVIEDALAQAIGAEHRSQDGTVARAGALGESAFFSFFPTKNLGGAGDAGMSVCRDAEFAEKLRLVPQSRDGAALFPPHGGRQFPHRCHPGRRAARQASLRGGMECRPPPQCGTLSAASGRGPAGDIFPANRGGRAA